MDLDPASLMVSFLVSGVGFVLLIYGKKQSRIPHIGAGVVMLVYPYFVSSWILSLAIGVVLVALLVAAVRFGA